MVEKNKEEKEEKEEKVEIVEEKKETSSNLKVILPVLCVALVALAAFISLTLKNKNESTKLIDNNLEEQVQPSNDELIEQEEITGNSMEVYYKTSEFCKSNFNGCDNSFKIATETTDTKIFDTYKKGYILYKDGTKIKLYSASSKKSKDINISNEYDFYNLVVDSKTNDPVGIIYNKGDSKIRNYYSIILDKDIYNNIYHDLSDIDGNYLSGGKYECNKSCDFVSVDLLSAREEKILNSAKATKEDTDEGSSKRFDYISNNNYRYYALVTMLDGYSYNKIYDEDLKEILSFNGYGIFENNISVNDKGQIYIVNDNKLNIYDNTGKQVNSISTYDKILQLVDEYIIAIKNNKLVIATIDGLEKTICEWKDNNNYHSGLSGWYETNGKNGIYMVVEDPNISTDEVWNYYKNLPEDDRDIESKEDLKSVDLGYEYYYIPTTGEVGKIPTYIGGYAKPILYLYPEKETKVTITFDHPEKLTTTYPKYKDNWTVYAKPNGDLRDLNNKYYYGLYWEEDLNHRVNFDEGFYVTKDNAIDFLEEKLSIIGFNDRERNEFIMYWLPILEKNEKNLVYFELTQERNGYSKINITPKPDSMLRVAIHVKKVKERTNIKEQKLTQFNRTGFSAVEWGGVVY